MGSRQFLTFLSKIHRALATTFYSEVANLRLKFYRVKVGKLLRATGPFDLHFDETATVTIGDFCRINSGFINNAVGGYRRTGIWVGKAGRLQIGDNVGISNSTVVALCSVIIEDNVYIGGDTNIYDTDFHSVKPEERYKNENKNNRPVVIHKNAFIGGHVIILKGVEIGEGAVVGAGSVVTSHVPPGEIWAGNPARFIAKV